MITFRSFDDGLQRFLRKEITGRQLLVKPTISNVSILLTYQCPARCDHCVFTSGPNRVETIEPALAQRYIRAASRLTPPPLISFSGGDPFSRLSLLRELAMLCYELGLYWEVISSSYWCVSLKHGYRLLSQFRDLGLRTYCTSVDPFHTAHIAPERMRNAILAATDCGINVLINTIARPEGDEREYLAHTLALPSVLLDRIKVNSLKVAPVGRAIEKVQDFHYREGAAMKEGCPYVTEVVPLSPNGKIYPCCGMTVQDYLPNNPFMYADISGKDEDSIFSILSEIKNDLFFRLLQTAGPYQILQRLSERTSSLHLPHRFVGSCHACIFLMNSSEAIEALWNYLGDLETDLAM